MVFYFTSNVVDPPAQIYMGRDKYENEDLIKHAWAEDVWFHVDKLSSAHVYLRLQPCKVVAGSSADTLQSPATPSPTMKRKGGLPSAAAAGKKKPATPAEDDHVYCTTWEDIPEVLLQDLAQLTKANSIEGNKKNNQAIIYTLASNLKKTGDMSTGSVSFHAPRQVRREHIAARENAIINRLNKTKQERNPDLQQEKLDHEKEQRSKFKEEDRKRMAEEQRLEEERKREKDLRSYDSLFDEANMVSNKDAFDDDDFM